jgi:hypothetical protein
VLSALGAAASRGELVALVDTFDTFDPPSARACGVDLTHLLWVRGQSRTIEGRRFDSGFRTPDSGLQTPDSGLRTPDSVVLDRALKAFSLILQAGGFGLVVLDLADATHAAIRRLPFTTWFRLQRPIEGSSMACVLLAGEPIARSAGGVTIALRRIEREAGPSAASSTLFTGFDIEARIGRARGVAETCAFACAATT